MSQDFELLRKRYKPDQIRILLVGESRPAGGTFFYKNDSHLYKSTRKATEQYLDETFHSDDAFLSWFKSNGFYLDDLCIEPINHESKPERRRKWKAAESDFSGRVSCYDPGAIIVIMMGIEKSVRRGVLASESASLLDTDRFFSLPFPNSRIASGNTLTNRQRYEAGYSRILKKLFGDRSRGVLPLKDT